MDVPTLEIKEVFRIGPVVVTETVVTTWGLMVAFAAVAFWINRRLSRKPGAFQMMIEALMTYFDGQIREIVNRPPARYFPLTATLFLFILFANLISVIPKVNSPTADLSTTTALAVLVFFTVPFFGILERGIKGYLHSYLKPAWIMLPFNLIGEFSRTLALSVRLFGNMMSGQLVVGVLVALAGIAAAAIEILGMITGVVQAYIFTILTLVYIGGAVRAAQIDKERDEKKRSRAENDEEPAVGSAP